MSWSHIFPEFFVSTFSFVSALSNFARGYVWFAFQVHFRYNWFIDR